MEVFDDDDMHTDAIMHIMSCSSLKCMNAIFFSTCICIVVRWNS
jgi:hypothetical protein